MCSIQSSTVSQCPAKVFSESKIRNAPILNLESQRLNAFVYTGLHAQKQYMGLGWDGVGWKSLKAPRWYLFYEHRSAVLISLIYQHPQILVGGSYFRRLLGKAL